MRHSTSRTAVGIVAVAVACVATPAFAQTYSRLPDFARFEMPDNARRVTDAEQIAELTGRLKRIADEEKIPVTAMEFLEWDSNGGDDSSTKIMLTSTLNGAGFVVTDGDGGDRFVARSDTRRPIVGVWTTRGGRLILAWGSTAPAAPKAPPPSLGDLLPPSSSSPAPSPTPSSVTRAAGRKIAPPADIVGRKWSWTTIGGVNYVNQRTGQMASPSGMSSKFTFTKDGRYDFFFYVQQRTYGLMSQSTTTERGTATFYDNGTVVLRPSAGHYKGDTGSRLIDRDMTDAERKPRTFYWVWRTENGKRQLYIGPGPSSLSPFKSTD